MTVDEFIGQNNERTHSPSQSQLEATKARASIKRKARATEETSQQILASERRNISEGALKRNIRHAREERNMLPNPQIRDEIPALPQEYQLTTNGD